MEEKKKVSVATILLTVVVIILVAICALMYVQMEQTKAEITELNEKMSNFGQDDVKEEIKNNEKDQSFLTYQENYKKAYQQFMKEGNTIDIYPEYEIPGVYRIYLDSNNDAYFQFEKDSELYTKYGEIYKVETGVANIFLCDNGTGGYADAIFLKLDGTASYINGFKVEQTSVVESNQVEGIQNAVNVISYTEVFYENEEETAAAPAYVFIDMNGNIIK